MVFYRLEGIPSYRAIHGRLVKANGKASSFPCHFCGEPAKHWACFRNKDHEQQLHNGKVTYSINEDDYVPACISCNSKMDRPPKETCKNGHDNWDNNKKRRCRTCFNEWQRNYRKNKLDNNRSN